MEQQQGGDLSSHFLMVSHLTLDELVQQEESAEEEVECLVAIGRAFNFQDF